MLYNDLKLDYLKNILNLDFAHFSYVNKMCSCCFSISNFPSEYWRDGKIVCKNTIDFDKLNFILFKNSIDGTGEVSVNDNLSDFESIEYQFENKEKLINFCNELSNICNKFGYQVLIPPNNDLSVILVNSKGLLNKLNKKRYDRYINMGYNGIN